MATVLQMEGRRCVCQSSVSWGRKQTCEFCLGSGFNFHPLIRYIPSEDVELCICPNCGYTADIDAFDVGGADEDCVFCTQCQEEIAC